MSTSASDEESEFSHEVSISNRNKRERNTICQRNIRAAKKIKVSTTDKINAAVQSIEENGFYITEFNSDLCSFIAGYYAAFDLSNNKKFKKDFEITGKQVQYAMIDSEKEKFMEDIEPFIKNELEIVEAYFKKKDDKMQFNTVKFTTNHENGKLSNCKEQYPHQDVITDKYLFVIIPLPATVLSTRVYGSLDEYTNLKSEEQVMNFFTKEESILKRGHCMIIRPNIIHAGPMEAANKRDMMYLEYNGFTVGNKSYDQRFMHEYQVKDYFYQALDKLQTKRGWDLPKDGKKKAKYNIEKKSNIIVYNLSTNQFR